jgi:hypothetical protein
VNQGGIDLILLIAGNDQDALLCGSLPFSERIFGRRVAKQDREAFRLIAVLIPHGVNVGIR